MKDVRHLLHGESASTRWERRGRQPPASLLAGGGDRKQGSAGVSKKEKERVRHRENGEQREIGGMLLSQIEGDDRKSKKKM